MARGTHTKKKGTAMKSTPLTILMDDLNEHHAVCLILILRANTDV